MSSPIALGMLYLAAAVQMAAAVLALFLIPLSGRRWFWIVMSAGLVLQAWRRLYLVITPANAETLPQAATGLLVSVLLLAGIIGLRTFFLSHKRIREEFRLEKTRADSYLNVAGAVVVVLDNIGRVVDLNEQARSLLEWRLDEIRGTDWFELTLLPSVRERVKSEFESLISKKAEKDVYVEYGVLDRKGREHQVVWHMCLMCGEEGEALGVRASGIDVTERRRLQEELRFRSAMLDKTSDSIIVTETDGTIMYVNDAACRLRGLEREQLLGKNLREIITERALDESWPQMERLVKGGSAIVESETIRADGRKIPLELRAHLISEGAVPLVVIIALDVTERKEAEEAIRHMAYHDALTGLPNRVLLLDRAQMVLGQARRHVQPAALVFVDVDNLKAVNDAVGHTRGDDVLRAIGGRLRGVFRDGDTVARFGGDEFVVLLPFTTRQAAYRAAAKICESVREPVSIADRIITPTVSVGVSIFPEDGEDLDTLLGKADEAMYAAKQRGRDTFVFFSEPEMGVQGMPTPATE